MIFCIQTERNHSKSEESSKEMFKVQVTLYQCFDIDAIVSKQGNFPLSKTIKIGIQMELAIQNRRKVQQKCPSHTISVGFI